MGYGQRDKLCGATYTHHIPHASRSDVLHDCGMSLLSRTAEYAILQI